MTNIGALKHAALDIREWLDANLMQPGLMDSEWNVINDAAKQIAGIVNAVIEREGQKRLPLDMAAHTD